MTQKLCPNKHKIAKTLISKIKQNNNVTSRANISVEQKKNHLVQNVDSKAIQGTLENELITFSFELD